jgi:signal transduction histidine kinase/PAS domain-containing protein
MKTASKRLKVLLVEDSPEDIALLVRELETCGYKPVSRVVKTATELRRALSRGKWDLVFSAYRLQDIDAPRALELLRQSGRDIPLIIVSDEIGGELAVAAVKCGASDFLLKGNLARLKAVVERELGEAEQRRLHREEADLARGRGEWEAVVDVVSELIIITDLEGAILHCNGRAGASFGGYDAVVGQRIDRLLFGDVQPEGEVFRFMHTLRSQIDEDVPIPHLGGWYNVASYPVGFGSGSPGIVFIIKDVTRRRQEEEEKRMTDRELLTLYAVAFRLQYSEGIDKTMGDLLFQLHNMLQMDFSCIHLVKGERLQLRASLGLAPAFERAVKSLKNPGGWGSTVLTRRPLRGDLPPAGISLKAKRAAVAMGISSWCCVPLRVGQDMLGVMTVGTRSARSYNDRDTFLLSTIAGQLAVLIENYSLYDKMKEKAEELYRHQEELGVNLQQLQRANQELGRLNTAKNNFIGIASHELKTPITSIMGGVEFLLKYSGIKMTPEQHAIFVSVYEGTVQLRKLVENLLSISRIEAQGTLPQKKPVDLMRLGGEVHEMFALPLSERSIKVRIAGDHTPVPVDESFALMAAKNLLENAIKFTNDGGEVELSGRVVELRDLKPMAAGVRSFYPDFPECLRAANRYYLFQVADTGIGIPAEERVRIFDKFYGVGDIAHHSSGDTAFMSQGTGLGLSIVRGIMDVHEGAVWVQANASGKGSAFYLLFPLDGE